MKPASKRVSGARLPAHLTAFAREEWRRLAPAARRAGTLTAASARSFELLVETLATERKARELVDADGITVTTGRGGVKPHPAVRTMEAARMQSALLLKLFRLEPGKRAPGEQPQSKGRSTWHGVLK